MDDFTLQLIKERQDRQDTRLDELEAEHDALAAKGAERDLKVDLMTQSFNRLSVAIASTLVIIVGSAAAVIFLGAHP